MQEVVRKMGARRAIIFLGVSMAALFLASSLLPAQPSVQPTSPEGKIAFVRPGTEPSEHCLEQPCADIWVMDADGSNQTNLTPTDDQKPPPRKQRTSTNTNPLGRHRAPRSSS